MSVWYHIVGHPHDFQDNHVGLEGMIGAGWIMQRQETMLDWYLLNPAWSEVEVMRDANPPYGDRYQFHINVYPGEVEDQSVRAAIEIATRDVLKAMCDDILTGGAQIIKEAQGSGGKRWENWG